MSGCATYRYDLLQPAGVSGPVPRDQQRAFTLDPLRYAVGVADDRLSLQIYNPTADTIRLIGGASWVVDPVDRSHPLIDQTIAPQSYVRVVLPPLRPWYGAMDYVSESSGIGLEDYGELDADERAAYGNGLAGDGPHGGTPGYDRASPVYWDWPAPGHVRVRLVFIRPDGSRFEQALTFRRRKG